MNTEVLKNLIWLSGIGHIVLCLGSTAVPVALNWKLHLKNLQPLLRQMFWTYAGYILMINFCFGLICLFGTDELVANSFLARSLNAMIFGYWLIRIGIQFFYFDKTDAPKGLIYTIGEIILVILFCAFTTIHLLALLSFTSWF